MKCQTFFHGVVSQGIAVTNHAKHGAVAFLGSNTAGGRAMLVSLNRKNPADIRRGHVFYANPTVIEYDDDDGRHIRFPVLSKPYKHSRDVLLRVNASQRDVCLSSTWEPASGAPELIVGGWGCDNPDRDQRRNSTNFKWTDDLVVLHEGDAINIIADPMDGEERRWMVKNEAGEATIFDPLASDQGDADTAAAIEQDRAVAV